MSVAVERGDEGAGVPAAPVATQGAVDRPGVALEGRGLGRLVVRNLLLTLVTLGVYRFWARTNLRRLIWSGTTVGGDPLAYTGRGRELFVGFLVALVVMLPALIVINILTGLIPPTDFALLAVAYAVIGLVFGLLGILARYHSRRYMLTRTSWRGLRAGQDATLGGYFRAHAWPWIATGLTLGLAAPWAAARTYAYRMAHTHIGTGRFAAAPRAAALWGPYLPFWAVLLAATVTFTLFFGPFWVYGQEVLAADQQGLPAPAPPQPGLHWLAVSAVLGFAAWLLSIRYRAARFRHFAATTTLEGMRFSSTLRARDLGGVVFGHVAFILLGLLGGGAVAAGFFVLFGKFGGVIAVPAFLICCYAGYYLSNLLWALPQTIERAVSNLSIENIAAADGFMNRADAGPRRGEGLADALGDVGL